MRQRNGLKSLPVFLVAMILAAVAMPLPSAAQVLYGSLVGNVKDTTGAVVPGAAVTITHKETNQTRQGLTNEAGGYSFPTIASGTYLVKVSKEGFKSFTSAETPVTLNSVARVDVTLEVGAVVETVTVMGEAPVLQTDRSEVRAEIGNKTLVNLPVPLGRNYQYLFRTLPGFAPPANAHSIPTNPSRALAFNVNGTSRSSNNTRIDGASNFTIQLPHVVAYVPSLEAIETVNVVTSSFDAEQGLAGGAAINVQTRSGTNQLHGSAFEYHTDNQLKAKPFFLPTGERNPKWIYNQFGAAVGGPVVKNKLFYFAAYEGTYDRQNASRFATVPTAAIKRGDMSESPRLVYDPLTGDAAGANRTAFPDNIVPAGRISAISRKLADLTPLPNLSGLTSNYFGTAAFLFDRHTADTKVNWNLTDKLSTFGRFSILRYNSFNERVLGALGGQPIGPRVGTGNPGIGDGSTYSLTVAATYLLKPNFVLDAYYGYTRMNTNSQQQRLDEKLGLDFLGIPGTNGPRRFEGAWPRFVINNYDTLGESTTFMPYFRRDPQAQWVSNFNWTKGTHEIRFGFDVYRQHLNQTQVEFVAGSFEGAAGGFTFSGGPTTTRGGAASNQFNSYAAFLLGLPTNIGKILQVPDEYHLRLWWHSYYIRDRWNVTPKLTLSYGLRWEYFPVPTRPDRGIERYDLAANKMMICGFGSVPEDCGIEVSKRRFAPRLGIAYRASNSFVIRAGYGITNDPFGATELFRANYPVLIPLTIDGPNAFQPAGRLENGIPPVRVPDFGNGIIDVPSNVGIATLPQKFERGYIQSWNFTLQKQLRYGFTGQVGYVATRQVRQVGYLDINAGQVIGAGQAGRPLLQKFGRTADTVFLSPFGTGHYDSLQAILERRFSRGIQLGANYTWGKAIGIADNSDSSPAVRAQPYFGLNRAVRGYDRTHNLQITNIWELPFGRGRKWVNSRGAASAIFGGWQVNNIFSLMSGTPFTVTSSGTSLDLPGSSQRADQVQPEVKKLGAAGRGMSYFDPLAFAPVTQPRFGTAGFNAMRGPGAVNWDFGVFRTFQMTERFKLEFRMESFNFSNTPHFGNPGNSASSLVLNNDGTIRSLGGYTEITSTTGIGREGIDERQFRFGLRLSF